MRRAKVLQAALFGQDQLVETYNKYSRFVPAAAFGAGMLFDIITAGRIDDRFTLIQQAVYLTIAAALLILEIFDREKPLVVPARLAKPWHYREEAMHFLLGSLLSSFTIFYFKSSSLLGSSLFFLFILALLVGNEFATVRNVGLQIRCILFCTVFTSYLFVLVPIFWGSIGIWQFLTSLALSGAFLGLLYATLHKRIQTPDLLKKKVMIPYGAVCGLFLFLYLVKFIPPVPLSLTHIGVYRSVDRANGGYLVKHTRPFWKFWSNGDQSFAYRAGDKIYVFFSVFSPGGFRDQVKIRWLYKDPKTGWRSSDAMPVSIAGGREKGWRGFAFKANYQPGRWQVRVETSDEREIGRINLTAYPDEDTAPRELIEEQL